MSGVSPLLLAVAAATLVCTLLWTRMWTRTALPLGGWALRDGGAALQVVHGDKLVAEFAETSPNLPCLVGNLGYVSAPSVQGTLMRSGSVCTADTRGYAVQRPLTVDTFANTDFVLGQGGWRQAKFWNDRMGSPTGCGRPNAPLAPEVALEQSFAPPPCGFGKSAKQACPAPTPLVVT